MLKKEGKYYLVRLFFLRKRVVTIFGLFDGWGHVFATSANLRSCTKEMAVSPSFTVRMGENVKQKCSAFE